MSWTRRDFLKVSAYGVAASALPRPLLLLAQSGRGEFSAIRRNVGTFSERGGTVGWLANGDGVIVVDSQFPDTAPNFLSGLRARTTRPIDALINSHHHGDHTGGNGVFREAARRIVAHANVPDLQQAQARQREIEDQQTYADTTFDESWSVTVGDETVRAKYYGPAHTGGDATIFFEQANIVHMGDLVFHGLHPFVDRPGGASVQGWIRLMEQVADEHSADTIYIFGHADEGYSITGSRADLLAQRDYLSVLRETAETAVREGRSREEAVGLSLPAPFGDYGAAQRLETALGAAYDELSAR